MHLFSDSVMIDTNDEVQRELEQGSQPQRQKRKSDETCCNMPAVVACKRCKVEDFVSKAVTCFCLKMDSLHASLLDQSNYIFANWADLAT